MKQRSVVLSPESAKPVQQDTPYYSSTSGHMVFADGYATNILTRLPCPCCIKFSLRPRRRRSWSPHCQAVIPRGFEYGCQMCGREYHWVCFFQHLPCGDDVDSSSDNAAHEYVAPPSEPAGDASFCARCRQAFAPSRHCNSCGYAFHRMCYFQHLPCGREDPEAIEEEDSPHGSFPLSLASQPFYKRSLSCITVGGVSLVPQSRLGSSDGCAV